MEDRFTFKCWNCNKDYTLFREITDQQELIVACPYCGEEGVVDLNPYRKTVMTVVRSVEAKEQSRGQELDLSEVLPTRKPD